MQGGLYTKRNWSLRATAYFMFWGMKVADDDSSKFTVYGNERTIASPFSFINRVILKG